MNPQQTSNPIGPPPSPVGPDVIVPPKPGGLPEVNISSDSSPQYDPNYTPSNPVQTPSLGTNQPMPNVAPQQVQQPTGPLATSGGYGSGGGSDMIRKIAIILGGLLLLGLLLFALWWFFIRSSGPDTAKIDNVILVERNLNGISYEFSTPEGASENVDAQLDIEDPLDQFSFSKANGSGDQEFLGQSFVEVNTQDPTISDIYDEDYIANLTTSIEDAYGLSSVAVGDLIEYSSDNVQDAATAELTGQGREGLSFNGRVLTTLVDDKAYNFVMVAPTENWQANTASIDSIYASFKVNDESGNPQVKQTGDELDVDIFTTVTEIAGPSVSGVTQDDILEYNIDVTNAGPETVKESSAEIVFSVDNEIVEIVSLNDLAANFDCDTSVGERTSVTGEMNCTIVNDLAAGVTASLGIRYKHVSDFNSDVVATAEVDNLITADWLDNDSTADDSNATTYKAVQDDTTVTEEPDPAEEPVTTETPTTTPDNSTEEKSSLPDTAGGENVELYLPLMIAIASALIIILPKKHVKQTIKK